MFLDFSKFFWIFPRFPNISECFYFLSKYLYFFNIFVSYFLGRPVPTLIWEPRPRVYNIIRPLGWWGAGPKPGSAAPESWFGWGYSPFRLCVWARLCLLLKLGANGQGCSGEYSAFRLWAWARLCLPKSLEANRRDCSEGYSAFRLCARARWCLPMNLGANLLGGFPGSETL